MAAATEKKQGLVGTIISWLIIGLIAAVVLAVAVIPRVLGAVPLTVLTGSMTPTYRPGDIVIVQPVPAESLAIGDVVTFQPISDDPRLTTHRIVDIVSQNGTVISVITRGDANNVDDAPIIPEQIQGKVIYSVPLVGHLTTTRNAIMAGGLFVGGGFVLYTIREIIKSQKTKKQEQLT